MPDPTGVESPTTPDKESLPEKDDLERRKLDLECKKILAETHALPSALWQRPAFMGAMSPIVVGVLALSTGVFTGFFNNERKLLKAETDALKSERAALTSELKTLKEEKAKIAGQIKRTINEIREVEASIPDARLSEDPELVEAAFAALEEATHKARVLLEALPLGDSASADMQQAP